MEKLKLSDIVTKLPFKVQKDITIFLHVRDFVLNTYGDKYDFDIYLKSKGKNLQRPYVWNLHQKQQLILSVLKGIDIGRITVIRYKEDGHKTNDSVLYKIIDGKQRLLTLINFMTGEFYIEVNGKKYYFNDLDNECIGRLYRMGIVGDIVYEYHDTIISDDDLIKWFELINFSGTPQDEQHILDLKK